MKKTIKQKINQIISNIKNLTFKDLVFIIFFGGGIFILYHWKEITDFVYDKSFMAGELFCVFSFNLYLFTGLYLLGEITFNTYSTYKKFLAKYSHFQKSANPLQHLIYAMVKSRKFLKKIFKK